MQSAASGKEPTRFYDADLSLGGAGAKVPKVLAATMPAACFAILGVELCERLAFYTFTGTQEFFLEHLGYSVSEASGMNAAMGTLCMAWAIFAGWVADVVLGRYMTILVFGLIYAAGSFVAAIAAFPAAESTRLYMLGVMVLVPLGTAGIKANISNFGADQYDTSDPAQALAQEKFFSWFYMSINMGSAVAYGYLTTLGSSGGMGIPKSYGYFAVYVIAALCMTFAVFIFRSRHDVYRTRPVGRQSALGVVTRRVLEVARGGSQEAQSVCLGLVLVVLCIVLSVWQAVLPESWFAPYLAKAAFVCAAFGILAVVLPCRSPKWVNGEDSISDSLREFTDQEVQDFLRLLPLLFTANLAFSAVYNSMQFWYQQQACQMDLRFGGTQLAGSFFTIADCLGIVVSTPIALGYLNPYLEKRSGGNFGHGAKYGLGMTFAAVSVLVAARFEEQRKRSPVLDIPSNCAPAGVNMSSMSAMWMVVPFFLMGLGEIYTQPVLMHLSYTQSPKSMRTLTAATGLVVGAVSNALFSVQVAALAPYVPNDLNGGHLEYGYFANVLLGGVFYLAYLRTLSTFEEKVY